MCFAIACSLWLPLFKLEQKKDASIRQGSRLKNWGLTAAIFISYFIWNNSLCLEQSQFMMKPVEQWFIRIILFARLNSRWHVSKKNPNLYQSTYFYYLVCSAISETKVLNLDMAWIFWLIINFKRIVTIPFFMDYHVNSLDKSRGDVFHIP